MTQSIEGVRDLRAMAQINSIGMALSHLRMARQRLRDAGANRAADYVARALKSAEGALRHAQNKETHDAA